MVHLDAHRAQVADPGEKGLKGGALGLFSSVVIGVASTAPAYSLAATLGFVVIAINGLGAPIITILAFIPMLFDLLRLQGAELRRPRLRHHVHLGREGLRPQDGLVRRVGHRGGRHPRDGQPGPDRGAIRLPTLRRRRHRVQPVTAAGCSWSGSCGSSHDGDLLHRDRGLGQLAEGLAQHRAHDARPVLGGRVGESRLRATHPLAISHPSAEWFNPFHHLSFTGFMVGFTLMLFIYWGWDTVRIGQRGDGRFPPYARAAQRFCPR